VCGSEGIVRGCRGQTLENDETLVGRYRAQIERPDDALVGRATGEDGARLLAADRADNPASVFIARSLPACRRRSSSAVPLCSAAPPPIVHQKGVCRRRRGSFRLARQVGIEGDDRTSGGKPVPVGGRDIGIVKARESLSRRQALGHTLQFLRGVCEDGFECFGPRLRPVGSEKRARPRSIALNG